VGGTEEETVDARIIAATNQDLGAMVESGDFREDLYYRINVIPIHLPPLRERREDVPLLVDHFLDKYCRQLGLDGRSVSVPAMRVLEAYDWPGNVRELENVLERAVALSSGEVLKREDLPGHLLRGGRDDDAAVSLPAEGLALEAYLEGVRGSLMSQALERCDGVQTRAAELLGMSFRSFRYYAKKSGLTGDDAAAEEDGRKVAREPSRESAQDAAQDVAQDPGSDAQ